MRNTISALTLISALCITRSARAQSDMHDPRTGPEASLHVGYGAFTNNATFCPTGTTCAGTGNVDGSLGLHLDAGYRIVPALSAGLHFGYQFLGLDPANAFGARDGGGSAVMLGLFVAAHPLGFIRAGAGPAWLEKVDIAIGVGFDFYANVTAWGTTFGQHGNVSLQTVAIPFALRVDYAVLPNVSVGLLGAVGPWVAVGDMCLNVDSSMFHSCDNRARSPEAYFFVGAGVRVHFNLLH